MSDVVLGILKFCLLALIYLFLARVVWVVIRELRTEPVSPGLGPAPGRTERPTRHAAPTPPTSDPSPATVRSQRLTVHHADGRSEDVTISGEATIGRGGGCTITLTDTFASHVHARLTPSGGGVVVEDLGSRNGTYVGPDRVTGQVALRSGDIIRIGQTNIEVGS